MQWSRCDSRNRLNMCQMNLLNVCTCINTLVCWVGYYISFHQIAVRASSLVAAQVITAQTPLMKSNIPPTTYASFDRASWAWEANQVTTYPDVSLGIEDRTFLDELLNANELVTSMLNSHEKMSSFKIRPYTYHSAMLHKHVNNIA